MFKKCHFQYEIANNKNKMITLYLQHRPKQVTYICSCDQSIRHCIVLISVFDYIEWFWVNYRLIYFHLITVNETPVTHTYYLLLITILSMTPPDKLTWFASMLQNLISNFRMCFKNCTTLVNLKVLFSKTLRKFDVSRGFFLTAVVVFLF